MKAIKRNYRSGASDASDVNCLDKNGNESNVQDVIDEQNQNLGGLSFGIDGDGNYGYYGADGSLIPFKKGGKLLDYSLWRYAGSFTKTFTKDDKFTECYVLCASVNAGSDPYVNYTSSNVTVTALATKDFQDSGSGWKFRSKLLKLTDIKEGSTITLSFHWTTVYIFFGS